MFPCLNGPAIRQRLQTEFPMTDSIILLAQVFTLAQTRKGNPEKINVFILFAEVWAAVPERK